MSPDAFKDWLRISPRPTLVMGVLNATPDGASPDGTGPKVVVPDKGFFAAAAAEEAADGH